MRLLLTVYLSEIDRLDGSGLYISEIGDIKKLLQIRYFKFFPIGKLNKQRVTGWMHEDSLDLPLLGSHKLELLCNLLLDNFTHLSPS